MLVFLLVAAMMLVAGLVVALVITVTLRRELGRADETIRSLVSGLNPVGRPGADRRRDPHR